MPGPMMSTTTETSSAPWATSLMLWVSTGESTPTTTTGPTLSESAGINGPAVPSGGPTTTDTRTTLDSFPSVAGPSHPSTNMPVTTRAHAELTLTSTGIRDCIKSTKHSSINDGQVLNYSFFLYTL
ncbi:hypothetical protein ANCCAN_00165, partial [Ancylostoma caninum]